MEGWLPLTVSQEGIIFIKDTATSQEPGGKLHILLIYSWYFQEDIRYYYYKDIRILLDRYPDTNTKIFRYYQTGWFLVKLRFCLMNNIVMLEWIPRPQATPGSTNTSDWSARPPHAPPESVLSLLVSLRLSWISYFHCVVAGWYPIMMTLLYFYPSAPTTNVIMIELHEELLNIITIILTTTSGPSLGHV